MQSVAVTVSFVASPSQATQLFDAVAKDFGARCAPNFNSGDSEGPGFQTVAFTVTKLGHTSSGLVPVRTFAFVTAGRILATATFANMAQPDEDPHRPNLGGRLLHSFETRVAKAVLGR